jgi:hypothetical protein
MLTKYTYITLAIMVSILSACATPPGKLKDSDFVMRTVNLKQPVSQSVSSFYDGLRYCGPESGGLVFVTHHGVPECAPPHPDGSTVCDLYIGRVGAGRSDNVLGRADFSPSETGTTVVLRVQSYVANKEKILDAWEKFSRGQAKEVCPEH